MSSSNIQAVLFDADGVTQLTGDFLRYMEEQYGWSEEKYDEFFHVLFRKDGYKESLKGNVDFITVLAENLAEFECDCNAGDFMYEWLHRNIVIDEEMWRNIGKLRSNGTKCYLASNQEKRRAHYIRNDLGYERHFDGLFFSCELGVLKPLPSYFKKILEAIRIPPVNVLFFDDYEDSVITAESLGIKAEVYKDYSTYLEVIEGYGLLK
jgi:putative hydrolase of the HAD superfamily